MALRLSPARDWPDPAPPQEAARHVAERHAGDDEPRQTTLTPRTGRLARSIPLLARPSRASGTEPRTRVRGSAPSTGTCRAGTPQEADASRCPASPGQLTGWGTASPAAPRPGPCTRPRTGRSRGQAADPTPLAVRVKGVSRSFGPALWAALDPTADAAGRAHTPPPGWATARRPPATRARPPTLGHGDYRGINVTVNLTGALTIGCTDSSHLLVSATVRRLPSKSSRASTAASLTASPRASTPHSQVPSKPSPASTTASLTASTDG